MIQWLTAQSLVIIAVGSAERAEGQSPDQGGSGCVLKCSSLTTRVIIPLPPGASEDLSNW